MRKFDFALEMFIFMVQLFNAMTDRGCCQQTPVFNPNNFNFNNQQQNIQQNLANQFGFDPQNPQSARLTGLNYNNVNWFNVDRRIEENWFHLYPFGERFWDSEIGARENGFGARPWHDRQIDLDFFFPYYGFRFNYTFIYPEGFIAFSYPWYIQPPYSFPELQWPARPDPSLIAAFLSPATFMHIGDVGISHVWYRIVERPNRLIRRRKQPPAGPNDFNNEGGAIYRTHDGWPSKTTYGNEQLKIREGRVEDPELLNTITKDIQEGMIGARGFLADYALIITWERMGYGGAPKSTNLQEFEQFKRAQNTYQMVIATDEIRSYVMTNYAHINWTSSTEAGSLAGRGGKQSAVVGFNGGNGTGFYQLPYSAEGNSYKLVEFGSTPTAGRWVSRVDEQIKYGGCTNASSGKLNVHSSYQNSIGGFSLNVSGPCFKTGQVVKLQIDKPEIDCQVLSMSVARCVTPVDQFRITGRVTVALSIDGGELFPFKTTMYLLPYIYSKSDIKFINDPIKTDDNWLSPDANNLTLKWKSANLTYDPNQNVDIIAWGYWENTMIGELSEVAILAENIANTGTYFFEPKVLRNNIRQLGQNIIRGNKPWKKFNFGLLQVRLHGEHAYTSGDQFQWSPLVGFPWMFKDEWESDQGSNWALEKCIEWYEYDGNKENYVMSLEEVGLACPCTMEQAQLDIGRFFPLYNCDPDGDAQCSYYSGSAGCYLSARASPNGAGQLCCYNGGGWLMFSQDYEYNPDYPSFMVAGGAQRAHLWGSPPMWRPPYIAAFSNYFNDQMSWQFCCQMSTNCELYHWRRETSTCQNYMPPVAGFAYGEPHFITFDGTKYTFNGKGYYVLAAMKSPKHNAMVQIRLEEPPDSIWNTRTMGSVITGVAARVGGSAKVEVFARKEFRRWRYKMDVYVDGKRIFSDRPNKKYQLFTGVSVLSPARNFDTSEVVIMFHTGVGVRVSENRGLLDVAVVMPPEYNQTLASEIDIDDNGEPINSGSKPGKCDGYYRLFGLLGNWNGDPDDDLENPDCQVLNVNYPPDAGSAESIFNNFGQKYRADGKMFSILFGSSNPPLYNPLTFAEDYQRIWQPVFDPKLLPNTNSNFVFTLPEAEVTCQGSYECLYDYLVTGRREIALDTLRIERQSLGMKGGEQIVVSCGPLQKNKGIIKFPVGENYIEGVEVTFACQPEYFIHGSLRRTCRNGTWSPGWWTWCRDRTEEYALKYLTGILVSLLIIGIIIFIFWWCYKLNVKGRVHRDLNAPPQGPVIIATLDNLRDPFKASEWDDRNEMTTGHFQYQGSESVLERQFPKSTII